MQQYSLKSLKVKNLNTVEQLKVDFDNLSYILTGENLFDSGQKSNGSGKSTFLNSIAIALIDATLNDCSVKSLVRNDGLEVELSLSGPSEIWIKREYSKTESQRVFLSEDGKEPEITNKQGGGFEVKAANEWILQKLSLSKEEVLTFFILSERYYQPFLASTNGQKLKIVSKLASLDKTEQAVDKAKKKVTEKSRELSAVKHELDKLQSNLSVLKDSKPQQEKEDAPPLENQKTEKESEVKSLQSDSEKLSPVEDVLKAIKEKKQATDQIIRSLHSKIQELGLIASHSVTCPNCEHAFAPGYDMSPQDAEKEMKQKQAQLQKANDALQLLNKQQSDAEQLRQRKERIDYQIPAIKREIEMLSRQIEQVLQRNSQIQQAQKTYQDKLLNLSSQILEKQKLVESTQEEYATLTEDVSLLEQFKFEQANSFIQKIVYYTNRFLEKSHSDFRIDIEGFVQNAKGEMRQRLNTLVKKNGEKREYYSLSSGEKVRVNTACDLSIQKILNDTRTTGLNYYQADEIFSTVDIEGVQNATEFLSSEGVQSILVAHSIENLNYPHRIELVKDVDGKTKLKDA